MIPSTFNRRQSSARNQWWIRATRLGDSWTRLQLRAPNKHTQQHALVQVQRLRQPTAHLCYVEDDLDIDCLFTYGTPGNFQEQHFYPQDFILQIAFLKSYYCSTKQWLQLAIRSTWYLLPWSCSKIYGYTCVGKWWQIFPCQARHCTTSRISLEFSARFTQNTVLQHLLHMHITKALDKNHTQQGLSGIFLHESKIKMLV